MRRTTKRVPVVATTASAVPPTTSAELIRPMPPRPPCTLRGAIVVDPVGVGLPAEIVRRIFAVDVGDVLQMNVTS